MSKRNMPSQNKPKLITGYIAPSQTLPDGSLMIHAEASCTFPTIVTATDVANCSLAWFAPNGLNRGSVPKIDKNLFQKSKTFTSNRWQYNSPDIVSNKWVNEVKNNPNRNQNVYSKEYVSAVDKVFSEKSYTLNHSSNNCFHRNWNNDPGYNLGI